MREHGFRKRGRTYNCTTEDQLTQVINLQMGSFDPPGTTYVPGLRENLYGWFTVNLGVYVPEVARHFGGAEAKAFVQEPYCCIRSRLGELGPGHRDLWWRISADQSLSREILDRLEQDGLPFLARFQTRDLILQEWHDVSANQGAGGPPRIILALILWARGQQEEAQRLLAAQARENQTSHPHHAAYVRMLATKLGLAALDG